MTEQVIDLQKREEQVIREPHAGPQTWVLTRYEDEILYGGARGGGKTDAGIVWMMEPYENPLYRGLVLRHTYDDLKDWLDRAMNIYAEFGARAVGNPVEIIFPNLDDPSKDGAKIRLGHLKDMKSFEKYKGHEYQRILIEELTQILSEELYEKLLGSNRSTVAGIPAQLLATTNPDGPGRLRVKRRFIDVAEPLTTYYVPTPEGVADDGLNLTRIFIPARVTDNPTLIKSDPKYVRYLQSIKDNQLRLAWLDGDRDAFDVKGAIYSAQIKQARQEHRITTFPVEQGIPVHTVWDLGMHDNTAIIFWQEVAKEIRIVDCYTNNGEGLGFYAGILADKGYQYGNHYSIAHEVNVKEMGAGQTRLQQAQRYGINFIPVPTAGKRDGIEKARRVFAYCWFRVPTCQVLVDCLEIYRKIFNERLQDYMNEPFHGPESHYADAFRYLALVVRTEEIKAAVTKRAPARSMVSGRPLNDRQITHGRKKSRAFQRPQANYGLGSKIRQ